MFSWRSFLWEELKISSATPKTENACWSVLELVRFCLIVGSLTTTCSNIHVSGPQTRLINVLNFTKKLVHLISFNLYKDDRPTGILLTISHSVAECQFSSRLRLSEDNARAISRCCAIDRSISENNSVPHQKRSQGSFQKKLVPPSSFCMLVMGKYCACTEGKTLASLAPQQTRFVVGNFAFAKAVSGSDRPSVHTRMRSVELRLNDLVEIFPIRLRHFRSSDQLYH